MRVHLVTLPRDRGLGLPARRRRCRGKAHGRHLRSPAREWPLRLQNPQDMVASPPRLLCPSHFRRWASCRSCLPLPSPRASKCTPASTPSSQHSCLAPSETQSPEGGQRDGGVEPWARQGGALGGRWQMRRERGGCRAHLLPPAPDVLSS